MAPDINAITPLILPRDMVRVVFPLDQADPLPDISTLPGLVGRWNYASAPGTPVTVTYGFSDTAPGYDPGSYVSPTPNYTAYTADEMANVASVLAAYQAVAGISFELVADSAAAQMVFRKADLVTAAGFAYYPPFGGEAAYNGDGFFNTSGAGSVYLTFHELGHALGLGHEFDPGHPHPEDYGIPGGRYLSVVDQHYQPRPYYLTGNDASYSFNNLIFDPTTPMPLDILALQMLYGQNAATNAGDTVYTYAVNPNFYQTIWDGGGIDTINLSNQVNPCLVSLVDGSYSSIGLRDPFEGFSQYIIDYVTTTIGRTAEQYNDGSNLLAIAFDAVIENATGGSAGDRLIGNAVANVLRGAAGNDTLAGAAGNDTLDGGPGIDTMIGGPGNDVYFRNTAGDVVTELSGQGTDTVRSAVSYTLPANVENLLLTGTGNINGNGSAGNNILTGNAGNNVLDGKAGTDTLKGMDGNDTMVWASTDSYDGGAGTDALKLTGGNLNLATLADTRILNVETIDLTNASNNVLTLNAQDLLALSSTTNTLKVLGNAGDSVNIVPVTFNDLGVVGAFHKYTFGGGTLLVDTDITNVA